MRHFIAGIFAAVCLQLIGAQPFNQFYLSNRQNSDWFRGNQMFNYDGQDNDWYQRDFYGSDVEYKMCPPSMDEIGRATWVLMHSVAARYPDNPTPELQNMMRQFLDLINLFYPYPVNHVYFSSYMNNEPDTTSRRGLNQWMCNLHNEVNEKMGKSEFDCDYVDERWRDGSCY